MMSPGWPLFHMVASLPCDAVPVRRRDQDTDAHSRMAVRTGRRRPPASPGESPSLRNECLLSNHLARRARPAARADQGLGHPHLPCGGLTPGPVLNTDNKARPGYCLTGWSEHSKATDPCPTPGSCSLSPGAGLPPDEKRPVSKQGAGLGPAPPPLLPAGRAVTGTRTQALVTQVNSRARAWASPVCPDLTIPTANNQNRH